MGDMTEQVTKNDSAIRALRSLKREAVIAFLRDALPICLANLSINLAYLHGSVAREETHSESDVDIALVASRTLPRLEQLDLELDLNVALERMGLPRPDVRIINNASVDAQAKIIRHGHVVFAADAEAQTAYERVTLDRAAAMSATLERERRDYVARAKVELQSKGLLHAGR